MFRVTHISDTHGMFPKFPPSSLMVIHSGDMAPNETRGDAEHEVKFQEEWWRNNIARIANRISNRIFAFIRGNHDYFNPETLLIEHGVKAVNLEYKVVDLLGKRFYGVPNIPYIAGEWNYETRSPEMSEVVNAIPECDILVAHCPPYGICADATEGKSGGNATLFNWLSYACETPPHYIMCGHFHDSRGIGRLGNTIVSNAATVQHTFEVE